MTADDFLNEFGHFADAPNGIKKLRELILQLAVRGKLVDQDPNDEPASELLKKIEAEKAKLIAEGKIKKQKPLPPVVPDQVPYELPKGWEWARLPAVCSYSPGKTPSTKNPAYWNDDQAGIPWVSISDMDHFGYLTATKKHITQGAAEVVFRRPPEPAGSLLMSFKLTVGKICVSKIEAYHNEAIISVHPYKGVSRDYLFNALPQRALQGNTKSAIMGNTLNATSLAALLIPLPPLSEQKRIVAKVDQLMKLCDELEARQQVRTTARISLNNSCLNALTAPEEDQDKAWSRISNNFDLLYDTPETVAELRKSILQLAVMGRLVPQDTKEEPASELLKKIEAEKQRLSTEGKIKKQKPLPPIDPADVPYQLPNGWEWTRIGTLVSVSSGDGLTAKNMVAGEVPVFGGNGITGYHNAANVSKPTVVIGRVGYYCGSVHMTPERAWITDNAFITTFLEELIFSPFLVWLLKGTDLRLNDSATAQPVISGRKVYPLPVALPPLAEQKRIVAKVDTLMTLCDQLEAKLKQSQSDSESLTASIVNHLTEVA